MKYVLNTTREFTGTNWNHYYSKAFDQLRGLCAGILCDGVVSNEEAQYGRQWLRANSEILRTWPFNEIAHRIETIFADGIVTEEARAELNEVLQSLVGLETPTAGKAESPLEMALTRPVPDVVVAGSEFSLTGKFALGSRSKVVSVIEGKGGFFNSNPRQSTNFLIIGVFGSPNWKASSFGNKIEIANTIRQSCGNIAILLEI